jgi:hypothetical protein
MNIPKHVIDKKIHAKIKIFNVNEFSRIKICNNHVIRKNKIKKYILRKFQCNSLKFFIWWCFILFYLFWHYFDICFEFTFFIFYVIGIVLLVQKSITNP